MKRAQTLLEYLILVGIVAAVFIGIGPLFRRSVQAVVKIAADQLGNQQDSEQAIDETSGYLADELVVTRGSQVKRHRESPGGVTEYITADRTDVSTATITNMGFTNASD